MKYGIWHEARRRLRLPDDEFSRGVLLVRVGLHACGWLLAVGVSMLVWGSALGLAW